VKIISAEAKPQNMNQAKSIIIIFKLNLFYLVKMYFILGKKINPAKNRISHELKKKILE